MKKLHGKDLDNQLAIRAKAKEDRRKKKMTIREAAKANNMKASEYLEWEYGYDICPHKKWEDNLGGFPFPKVIFKQCKKCGMVNEKSMEKVMEKNLKRTYRTFKRIVKKRTETQEVD